MRRATTSLQRNQRGFVSIIVAMILIVLVSLIAIGFAFLASQNQRDNLNRQLSTQAFYAAESGVNDAIENLSTLGNLTSCNQTSGVGKQDLGNGVAYTCVLINNQPDDLTYDSISTDESTLVRVQANGTVANLQIGWQDSANASGFAGIAGGFKLPTQATIDGTSIGTPAAGYVSTTARFPSYIGMLRTTIIPANAVTSADNLLNRSQNIFLYPKGSASASQSGTVPFRSVGNMAADGVFGDGMCHANSTPRRCNVRITGIGLNDFYVRLKAIYKPVAVTITATDSGGNRLQLSGAQAVIDATGRAQDVVRRIQVRVPLSSSYYFPEYAIESADTICKRYAVWPGGAEVLSPLATLYNGGADAANDRLKDETVCQLPNQSKPNF